MKLVDSIVNAKQKIREAAQKAKEKFREINDELSSNVSTVNEIKERYAELSQHVDQSTLKNIDLPEDEYKEFLNLNKQLLKVFPELYKNYNSNGDAILNLSGNVDTIVSSLDNLIQKQKDLANIEMVKQMPDIFKGVKLDVSEYEKNIEKLEKESKLKIKEIFYDYESLADIFYSKDNEGNYRGINGTNFIETLIPSLNTSDIINYENALNKLGIKYEKIIMMLDDYSNGYKQKKEYVKYDYNTSLVSENINNIKEDSEEKANAIRYEYDTLVNLEKEKITQAYKELNSISEIWLPTTLYYSKFDDEFKQLSYEMVSNLNFEKIKDELPTERDMRDYITDNILFPLYNSSDEFKKLFKNFLNIKDSFETGKISQKEYDEYVNHIYSELKKSIETQSPAFKKIFENSFYNIFSNAKYNPLQETGYIGTFDDFTKAIDKIQEAYHSVSEAIDEYKENQYLSLDTMQKLLELDDKYLSVLFDENGQLKINKETYQELIKVQLVKMYTDLYNQTVNVVNSLGDEESALISLKEKTVEITEANWDLVDSLFAVARAKLDKEDSETGNPTLTQNRRALLDEKEKVALARKKLIKDTYDNIYSHLNGIMEKSKKETKEFSESIDWYLNSINNISTFIEVLNQKLDDNNTSYKEKINIIKELIDKQKELVDIEEKGSIVYKNHYNNKLNKLGANKNKYKSLIESNKELTVEDFNNENLYKSVKEAHDAWRKYQEQLKKYEDELRKYEDYQKNKYEIKISKYDYKIDNLQNLNENKEQEISLKKARKVNVKEPDYQYMIDNNDKLITENRNKLSDILAERKTINKKSDYYKQLTQDAHAVKVEISQLKEKQIEYNRELLKLPIQELEKEKKALEDQLKVIEEKEKKINTAISFAKTYIDQEVSYYNKLKDATTKSYDAQIKVYKDKLELLEKTNDVIKEQRALEKAQYEYNKAINEKTIKVYRENQGFVYEVDEEAVKEAKQNLDEEKFNQQKSIYNNKINDLEKEKTDELEILDAKIEALENYKDMIDEISSSYENMLGLQELINQYGINVLERIKSGDTKLIDSMREDFIDVQSEKDSTEKQIISIDNSITKINDLAEGWTGAARTIEEKKNEIERIVSDNSFELMAIQQRTQKTANLSNQWDKTKNTIQKDLYLINTDHSQAKDDEKNILDERLENLKKFSEYASSYLSSIISKLSEAKQKEIELDTINNKISNKTNDNNKNNKPNKSITNNKVNNNKYKKHSGMKTGYVGENLSASDKDNFRYIALNKMKPDEVPAILQLGESVLTQGQQYNIMHNIQSAFVMGTQIPNIQKMNIPSSNTISFNGDIIIEKLNGDVNEFARKVKSEFLLRLEQELYK